MGFTQIVHMWRIPAVCIPHGIFSDTGHLWFVLPFLIKSLVAVSEGESERQGSKYQRCDSLLSLARAEQHGHISHKEDQT